MQVVAAACLGAAEALGRTLDGASQIDGKAGVPGKTYTTCESERLCAEAQHNHHNTFTHMLASGFTFCRRGEATYGLDMLGCMPPTHG